MGRRQVVCVWLGMCVAMESVAPAAVVLYARHGQSTSPAPAAPPAAPQPPGVAAPGGQDLARRIREAVQLDYQLQRDFTYIERRRDVKISKLGKVTVGPLRTFEVFPSERPGGTYKRLIEVDGKRLPPEELARRDE